MDVTVGHAVLATVATGAAAVRGRVIRTMTEGAAARIEEISQKCFGMPYPNFTGQPETRVLITIAAEKITPPARD